MLEGGYTLLKQSRNHTQISFQHIYNFSTLMEGSASCENKFSETEPSLLLSAPQGGLGFVRETPVGKKKVKRISESVFTSPKCNLETWIPQTAPHPSHKYKRPRLSFTDNMSDPLIATPIRTPNFEKYKPDLSGFTDDDRIDIGSRTSKHQVSTPCPTAPSKVKLTRSQTVQKKRKAKIIRLTWETKEQVECITFFMIKHIF